MTPSGLVASLAVAGIVGFGFYLRTGVKRDIAHYKERTGKTWPAERAALALRLKQKQTSNETSGATTIALQPWLNAALTDSLGGRAETNRNNLEELPRGAHIFGGVPFDIAGRVQLTGRKLLETSTCFPAGVKNLKIGRSCCRFHLLHGASGLTPEMNGTTIANLVLHYVDGSQARLEIVGGTHVCDWWGPIYQTDAGADACEPSAPEAGLAWSGTNPCIKQQRPEQSLRLYRSTFNNPRPGVEITSIDYRSSLTDAAPFLVGLTVE